MSIYDDFEKNSANHAALSPLSFIKRTALMFPVPITLALLLTAACFCLVSIAWTVILTPILFYTVLFCSSWHFAGGR